MDKIYVKQMEFYGYHGVYSEENRLGQRFMVDLVIGLDLEMAGKTDRLDETINYADIYFTCKEIVEGKPRQLIESVAESIAETLLNNFPKIKTVTVTVNKPNPPIPGHFHSVAVEITRTRER